MKQAVIRFLLFYTYTLYAFIIRYSFRTYLTTYLSNKNITNFKIKKIFDSLNYKQKVLFLNFLRTVTGCVQFYDNSPIWE